MLTAGGPLQIILGKHANDLPGSGSAVVGAEPREWATAAGRFAWSQARSQEEE